MFVRFEPLARLHSIFTEAQKTTGKNNDRMRYNKASIEFKVSGKHSDQDLGYL